MSQGPPLRLPLVATLENRAGAQTVDARLINGYIETKNPGEVHCYKRPGYTSSSVVAAGQTGRGIFNWYDDIYSVFGTSFYVNGVATGAALVGGGFTFTSCLGATPKLFMNGLTSAYTYDSGGGLVKVVDADYPALTVPGAVFLDGTVYVMTPTCYILGSALNDPTSWDPLNSILAQIEPDKGVALAKQLSYVIAFKGDSTEVFYDAGNAAGSPLGRMEGAKIAYGCHNADSVVDIDGRLFWYAQAKSGRLCVAVLENLKVKIVSTPAVERMLAGATENYVRAYHLSVAGHVFYVLSVFNLANSPLTMVYDINEELWTYWQAGNTYGLPFVGSAINEFHGCLTQGRNDGIIYNFDSGFTDLGAAFSWDLYTPIFDGGSRFTKMVNILEIAADQQAGGILSISYSDDDYATWSTARDVNLADERPMLDSMGSFRRRAHHFHHEGTGPLRVMAVDLHVDLGTL